jgi:predicted aconitase with swiveling domain
MAELARRMLVGRVLVGGHGSGPALVLDEPLSFWGGFDAGTGRLVEARHPQAGASVSGKVLVMPAGRGSSSSSSVLAEALRRGTGPVAIVLAEPDEIIVLGALVPNLLDGSAFPVVTLGADDYASIRTDDVVTVAEDGRVTCSS